MIFAFSLLPLSAMAKGTVHKKGNTEAKKIAITFDDGPSKQNTELILEILREYGIRATFFVIGENAKRDPDRIRSIFEAGHEIGNHSYTHVYMTQLSEEQIRNEVKKPEAVLKEITGVRPTIFRPPGGYYNDLSCRVLEEMGYLNVLWSVDTRDWSMPDTDRIVSKVEENAGAGDIILFHDLEDKRLPTPKALRKIIPYLMENGYEFVGVSEILESKAG
jgi:polysaccharide deacetylase family sporulation protein PdaB